MAGHDVFVVTRDNNKDAIDAALAREPDLSLHPVYFDPRSPIRHVKRGPRGLRTYYIAWQREARRVFQALHRKRDFDLAHHLTFATDWLPATVLELPIPGVWGPVGGSSPSSLAFARALGVRGTFEELARDSFGGLGRRLWGTPSARRAVTVLANNAEVKKRFEWHPDVQVIPHSRVDASVHAGVIDDLGSPQEATLPRAVIVGRLIPWKGLALACEALANDAAQSWHLDVIGDGPEALRCQRLAERLRIADRVRFRGKLARFETLVRISRADALLNPALHDSAPFVVAEAVSLGVPVVCLDRCGPPVQVSPPHDVVVAARSQRDAVEGLARGLAEVASRRHAPRTPSDALAAEALPALIERIYCSAVARLDHGDAS